VKAFLAADAGMTYRHIAEVLLLDEGTISKHVADYVQDGKLQLETGARCEKLNAEVSQALATHLEVRTYMKVQDICA
jgi:predicted transcriptional regulator